MATGIYTIKTDKGSATVYQNPDNTVTVSSGDKKWTGSQADFNTAYGKAAGANPTSNVTVRNLDSGKSATVNAGVTANAAAALPSGGSSASSSGEDPMAKALAEANARAAKAEADRQATIAAAEKLQSDTKKATDAVSAGQTQAAVNAEMGKDATQTTTESASDDYNNALAAAITTKPAVTAGEKAAVVSEEEAKAKAVQTQLDQAELARQRYELDSKKLMDQRAGADMEEAKSKADYEAKKLEAKQKELDLQVEQSRKKAEKDTYDQERIASLNMMKLGLVGSGSAVATFQAIATNGITRLSEIQAEYSNKSAMIALDAKREADKLVYDLNKISDDYVEKRLLANKEGAEAIAKYQRSTTENQLQKDSNIKKKLDELKKEKRDDLEWSLKLYKERADQAQLAEDRLQKKADKLKADGKEKIKTLTDTGAWAKLSPEERAKLETDAGMPLGSSRMIIGKLVGEDVQKLIDDQGIKGYFPSGAAMDKLNSRVDQLLELGKDRVTATNIAFGELAQTDTNLRAALAKANAVKSGSPGSGSGKEVYFNSKSKVTGTDGITYTKTVRVPQSWADAQRAKGLSGTEIDDLAAYTFPSVEDSAIDDKPQTGWVTDPSTGVATEFVRNPDGTIGKPTGATKVGQAVKGGSSRGAAEAEEGIDSGEGKKVIPG
jgi:hypothetical protein